MPRSRSKLSAKEQAFRDAGAAAAMAISFEEGKPVLDLRSFFIGLNESFIDLRQVDVFLREYGTEEVAVLEEAREQIDNAGDMARDVLRRLSGFPDGS